jgi:hypothetical protein
MHPEKHTAISSCASVVARGIFVAVDSSRPPVHMLTISRLKCDDASDLRLFSSSEPYTEIILNNNNC